MDINHEISQLKNASPLARLEATSKLIAHGMEVTDAITEILTDKRSPPYTRACAIKVLGALKAEKAEDSIIAALGDTNMVVKCPAAVALGKLGSFKGVPALVHALNDESRFVSTFALDALTGIMRSSKTVEALNGLKPFIHGIDTHTRWGIHAKTKLCLEMHATSMRLMASQTLGAMAPSPSYAGQPAKKTLPSGVSKC